MLLQTVDITGIMDVPAEFPELEINEDNMELPGAIQQAEFELEQQAAANADLNEVPSNEPEDIGVFSVGDAVMDALSIGVDVAIALYADDDDLDENYLYDEEFEDDGNEGDDEYDSNDDDVDDESDYEIYTQYEDDPVAKKLDTTDDSETTDDESI